MSGSRRKQEKGPVKLMEWVKIAFIFTGYVKTVPAYDIKLVWVVLDLHAKELFETIY